jgi:hypothetical protein
MPPAAQPVAAAAAVEADKEPEDDEGKVVYYHKKFWEYASYYGKKAARDFYGDWSPAEDAPAPAGMVIKEDAVDTSTATAAPTPAATEENGATAAVTDATADAAAADAGTNDDADTGADVDDDAAPLTEEEEKAHAEEVAAYKAQYRTWWMEHGKASGAPEEPPALE